MQNKNKSAEHLYQYLSQKSREAYQDPLLIANIVLSKQLTSGRIMETYLEGKNPPKITFFFIAKRFFLYVVKNFIKYILCLITVLFHKISGQKFCIKEARELIILDAFFLMDRILKKGRFEDSFFPGLSQYLTKIRKAHAYVPRLFGSKDPFQLFRIFKILKRDNVPVLTHFQVLGPTDYLEVVRFLVLYPFAVVRFIKKLGNSYEDKILRYGLWEALGGSELELELRFLFGKRLSSSKVSKIKCIGWYENQASDKTFYRGLRHVPGKAEIMGTQFFIRPTTYLFLKPDEQEIPFNVVPDKVLVDGLGKCFDSNKVKVEVGPTLREKYIFELGEQSSDGEFILVLMSYYTHVTDFMLKTICEVDWCVPVKIKFHPTDDLRKYDAKVLQNFSITDEPLSDLLPKARIVLGRASGAQLQAIVCGTPVIDIENPAEFSHNLMPKTGKGIIWDHAANADEVTKLVRQFQESLLSNPIRLREEGLRIKSLYFSEPTEELINRAFGLD